MRLTAHLALIVFVLCGQCGKAGCDAYLKQNRFAGLRLGYACGHPILMNELAKIVPPYNMNQLSLTAAKFALRHYGWVEEQINILKRERSRLSEALSLLPEVKVFASEANFITIRVPDAELVLRH